MFELKINSCQIFHCGEDWSLDRVWNDLTMWFVTSGNVTLREDGEPFRVESGELVFLQPFLRYTSELDRKEPFSVMVCHFDFLKNTPPWDLDRSSNSVDLIFSQGIIHKVIDHLNRGNEEMAELWFGNFIKDLWESRESRKEHDISRSSPSTRMEIEEIRQLMNESVGESWSLPELASRLHVSADHFTRLFKAQVGITPKDYMINLRIQKAKGLLLTTSFSLGRIAEICGYQNLFYFSRQFKAKVGVSPFRFRK